MDYKDWTYPLVWGLPTKKLKEKYPKHKTTKLSSEYKQLELNNIYIRNMIGDCGSVYLEGVNNVSAKDLQECLTLISDSGFSKTFATVVKQMTKEEEKETIQMFKTLGFKLVAKGYSNRNEEKRDLIFLHYNKKCNYKGY